MKVKSVKLDTLSFLEHMLSVKDLKCPNPSRENRDDINIKSFSFHTEDVAANINVF